MRTDRRQFLHLTAATGAVLAGCSGTGEKAEWSEPEAAPAPAKAGAPRTVLVFGGTGLIGPHLVERLVARGHTVTLFNRGKTKAELFPELEKLRGDRDPSKGDGLKALEGRKFDIVFDDVGFYPRHVNTSAEMLAKAGSGHYVYVSSISAYAKNDVEGADETAELARMSDPTVETMGPNFEYYGPLKVLCEEASQAAFPGHCTIVRPGYIVGPGDNSDRFTYWPIRFNRGGTVLVPGAPTDPIQVIDVRDLADFLVKVGEGGVNGAFNACGPKERMSWGTVIEECRKASTAPSVTMRWATAAELRKFEGIDFPIWAPYEGETKGFHTWSNARGVKAGMAFRPIGTTVRDTLAWFATLPEERRAKVRAGPTPEKEAEVLAALG